MKQFPKILTKLFIISLIIFHFISSGFCQAPQYKIGLILPLTGPVAEYGIAFRNAVELAKEKKPSDFTNIKFIYEDSAYESSKAVGALRKLKAVNGIDLALVWGSGPGQATTPVAEIEKTPLIAISGDPTCTKGRKYSVSFLPSVEKNGVTLAGLINKLPYKKIGIVKQDLLFFDLTLSGLKKSLNKDITIDLIENVDLNQPDLKTMALKFKNRKVDLMGAFLVSGSIDVFYRKMNEIKFKVQTFGTDFFESKTEIARAGGLLEGAFFSNIYTSESFKSEYLKRYGTDAQVASAGNAYDFANFIAQVFAQSPASSEEILARVKIPEFEGVCGKYTFLETPDFGPGFDLPMTIKKIQNGEIVTGW